MTTTARDVLSELARVKVIFQARTLEAIIRGPHGTAATGGFPYFTSRAGVPAPLRSEPSPGPALPCATGAEMGD